MPLLVTDALCDPRLRLAAVVAEGVRVDAAPDAFEARLAAVLAARAGALPTAMEMRRLAVRAALRHGAYRPTGRAKPSAEYLLRAATEGTFPRVNAVVDAANAASLAALVPLSLWDLDLARGVASAAVAGAAVVGAEANGAEANGADDVLVVRRGRPGEAYVFNGAGQEIGVEDLVVGACGGGSAGEADGVACVSPVKDSLATKTTPATRRVGALVYAPAEAMTGAEVEALAADLARALGACGDGVRVAHGLVPPGGTCVLTPS